MPTYARVDLAFERGEGAWVFNPFAWQLLFVFGAWCALGGARRMSRILSSKVTLWLCIGYLAAAHRAA